MSAISKGREENKWMPPVAIRRRKRRSYKVPPVTREELNAAVENYLIAGGKITKLRAEEPPPGYEPSKLGDYITEFLRG